MAWRSFIRTGAAVLLGAAIAFPVGLMLGGNNPRHGMDQAAPDAQAPRWQPYSPNILNNRYFLDQQRQNVEALETACREFGHSCAEARQARRWIEELHATE